MNQYLELHLNFIFDLQAIYVLLPVLMPVLFCLVITRLSLASRKSRERIQLLEKDESYSSRLVHTLGQIERQVEDTVVEMIDDSGEVVPSSASTLAASPALAADVGLSAAKGQEAKAATAEKPHVTLSPLQHKLVKWLNSIPQLEKELVWIDPVRNSHAVIIARDITRFPDQQIGEGVLRHWADHLAA